MSKKSDFVQRVYQAALTAGLSDAAARVTASQAAIESDYGKAAPGNNFFGIKAGTSWTGPTQLLPTHEVVNGKTVKVKQPFRVYDTPEAGMADRVTMMDHAFPGFNQSATVGDAYNILQNGRYGRYATAGRADYESALNSVNANYLGGTPVPPENIPAGNNSSALSYTGTGDAATRSFQQQLGKAGFSPGPVDGINGSQTKAAIKAFQKANGLSVDGILGPQTQTALLAASGQSNDYGTFGGRLPDAAMNGVDRLNPGHVTHSPTDFTTQPLGNPYNSGGLGLPSPDLSASGSANVSRETSITKTVANPAYIHWQNTYGGMVNSSGSPDDRDAAHSALMGGLSMTGGVAPMTIPPPPSRTIQITYQPSAIPTQQGPGLLSTLGGYASNALGYLGNQASNVEAAVPGMATQAVNYLGPKMLGSVSGRTALFNAAFGTGTTIKDNPLKYGATQQERDDAAAARAALQNFGQSPTIDTTYRSAPVAPVSQPSQSSNHNRQQNNNNSSGGGGQTIQGSATGRTYVVGQKYSNGNGTYMATSNGFQRVN